MHSILLSDETKLTFLALALSAVIGEKPYIAHHTENSVRTVKHRGGSFMFWGLFHQHKNWDNGQG